MCSLFCRSNSPFLSSSWSGRLLLQAPLASCFPNHTINGVATAAVILVCHFLCYLVKLAALKK